jgi:DNA-binding transcriptional MerR regulator
MASLTHLNELEPPSKRYFTISEVSELCQVKTHVLRYWEQEFMALSPQKRRGNRRYYTYQDIMVVRKIRGLLYDQGFSIVGARKQLLDNSGVNSIGSDSQHAVLQDAISELEAIVSDLSAKIIDLGAAVADPK